jgi:hypothetical protein
LDLIDRQLAELTESGRVQRLERERWRDLVHEVTAVAGAGLGTLSDTLAAAESRGYFAAVRYGALAVDRMVTALDAGRRAPTPSALNLLRQLRDPQVRRGLARALDLLRALDPGPGSGPTERATRSAATSRPSEHQSHHHL